MTDIQIAQAAKMMPIEDLAKSIGLHPDSLSPYGRYIAKVDPAYYRDLPRRAKLVLVTAITPTPAGEGKTTISISLADGLHYNGKSAMLALREPSLGPVFGMKGGATGGGHVQVLPMENINMHFTGDLHAITTANNLLASMIDNHIQQGNTLNIDPRRITFRRCMDLNDRQLRSVISGLGGNANGMPREDGFDITAASEVMATFCMAQNLQDLKNRLACIVVARDYEGKAVTCGQIGAQGAMAALLRDAAMPNLVQTIDHTPCLIHGGPFANIAHGCNSVIATKLALKLSDYVITEAGFGGDLGAEKFLDIKCRQSGLWPDCVVLVATIRALKHHGGVAKADLSAENVPALEKGLCNLRQHIKNIRGIWQLPVVVALNHFATDTQAEIDTVLRAAEDEGVPCRFSDGWAQGGRGASEIASCVSDLLEGKQTPSPSYTYPEDLGLAEKIEAVATRVYHAGSVAFSPKVRGIIRQLEEDGWAKAPVCIAKTQYSFSDNPKVLGAPEGFELAIRDVRLSAGAGFVVAFAGDIIAMPGLPKQPAALQVDVDEAGRIDGIF